MSADFHSSPMKPLGFGWGNFFVVCAFLQSIFMFLKFIQTFLTGNAGFQAIAFLISLLAFGAGFGLMKRSRYGLYLVYVSLLFWLSKGIINLAGDTSSKVSAGIVSIIGSGLYFFYFFKRSDWLE
jgi:hypothetical protein